MQQLYAAAARGNRPLNYRLGSAGWQYLQTDSKENAARVLTLMQGQNESAYRLTDAQVAEVQRRCADPDDRRFTLEEFNERLSRLIGE